MIGTRLGHYEIKEKVGKGGMGEVYRAHDTTLGRDVAIKVLPEDMASDPERIARFEREARAVAALQHPNIVTIHSVERVDGRSCLTMELVSGTTLAELIPPTGLPLERFFELAIPLADALRAAHAKGITHRDLKPSNIMVDDEGRLRVLDFGLAKLLAGPAGGAETTLAESNVTAEGKILGTVNYMSPEQAEGKAVDHRSDIFSLGVVLYEMATGIRPFSGDTPISTLSSILKEKPPSVIQVRANLPRHLSRVINRCLEKNPEKRFQTARDVCNELEGLQKEVESGDIELPSSSSSISTDALVVDRPARGNRTWLAVGGVAAALALVAVAIYAIPRLGSEAAPSLLPVKTRPLTGSLGLEGAASWSPDGGFIAYNHSQTGPMDIFVMPSSGGDSITLVESPYDDVTPRWSPNNRWIAFASNRDGKTGVYVVPPLGGQVRFLADIGLQPMSNTIFAALGSQPWSPDGRTLLFGKLEEGRFAIWSVDIESGEQKQLTAPEAGVDDYSASFTFAGDRVVFGRSQEGASHVMVMPATGGGPASVVEEKEPYVTPAWAPDGEQIVYDTTSGGLWMVDSRTGVKRQLTSSETDHAPVVGRDGRILFEKSGHQTDIYLQDLDGGNEERLTSHTLDNFGPTISPDGRRIAYMSSRTGNAEIWVIDRQTGSERQLTNRDAYDASVSWSPDGTEIAFGSDHDGKYHLWVVSADGGLPRKLGDNELAGGGIGWAPDGSSIGIISRADPASAPALFLVDPTNGTSRKVLDKVSSFGWYRDAKHVIYSVATEGTDYEMRVASLDTGKSAVLLQTPFRELSVAPDGNAVTYCTSRSHSDMNLYLLPLTVPEDEGGLPTAAGPPSPITNGQGQWHVHNGGWSPDSKQVIYTRDTDTGDIYLLEGGL